MPEDEAEEVSGVAGENGVGLCACDLRGAGDFGNPAEVVPEIGVEWAEGLVDRERHGREEFDAVGLSLRAQAHDAIEEPIGALARREVRDVRGARGTPPWPWGAAEANGASPTGGGLDGVAGSAEALAGEKRDERQQRDRGDAPGEDRRRGARWDAAAMRVAGFQPQCRSGGRSARPA